MKKLKKPGIPVVAKDAPTKSMSKGSSASTASSSAPSGGKLPTILTGVNPYFGKWTVIQAEHEHRPMMPGPNRFQVGPPSRIDGSRIAQGSGSCIACNGFRQKSSVVTVYFPTGANVGYNINLCKSHLRDLADAVAYARSDAPLSEYKPRMMEAFEKGKK